MTPLLFKNARIFDGSNADCAEGMYRARRRRADPGGLAASRSPQPDARVIDVGGRTLMPGLIDAHMHAYCERRVDAEDRGDGRAVPHRARGRGCSAHALDCGFTTVRDIGGGDYSLAKAIADGLVRAPRFFYCRQDPVDDRRPWRLPADGAEIAHDHESCCSCGIVNWACRVADGVDACLQATRDELRQGAHCIKIMGSGGVASPTDPIWMNQYREDEIRAIVNECAERRTYVAAHCHPASAVRRCVEFGVRCIEHGTLIDDDTARFVAERGAYIVPTMVIIFALVEHGTPSSAFRRRARRRPSTRCKQALSGMDTMRKAGVKVGFGTDLLGPLYVQAVPRVHASAAKCSRRSRSCGRRRRSTPR